MFGLTFEKLLIIGVFAALIAGPARLPEYAQRLGELVRSFRAFTEATRRHAEAEAGVPLDPAAWRAQAAAIDPRRVVADALRDPLPPAAEPPVAGPGVTGGAVSHPQSARAQSADARPADAQPAGAEPAVPGPQVRQRWVVTGGSGHPRRVLVTEPIAESGTGSSGEDAEAAVAESTVA